jgi:hypothetical protein
MRVRLLCAVAIVLGAEFAIGCGYHAQTLFRDDIRTVYVEAFDNMTYRRGLEVLLSRAVLEELRLRTPLVFAPRDEADSVLSGALLEAGESTRVETETGMVVLQDVSVRARFSWQDRLSGAAIVPPQEVRASVREVPAAIDSGEDAGAVVAADQVRVEASFEAALRRLAERLVERMEANW